jgi:hypothetical protein
MSAVGENAQTVALLEATAETRTLIEDLTRLSEELKLRQERLGELLAPSEAALRARTEYLDKVTREQLGLAEQRVLKLGDEVESIARRLNDQVLQMPARLAEADARRWSGRERRERWRMVMGLAVTLVGGFLAGQVASCRSGGTNVKPPAVEQGTSTTKGAPARRTPGSGTKPSAAPAR